MSLIFILVKLNIKENKFLGIYKINPDGIGPRYVVISI